MAAPAARASTRTRGPAGRWVSFSATTTTEARSASARPWWGATSGRTVTRSGKVAATPLATASGTLITAATGAILRAATRVSQSRWACRAAQTEVDLQSRMCCPQRESGRMTFARSAPGSAHAATRCRRFECRPNGRLHLAPTVALPGTGHWLGTGNHSRQGGRAQAAARAFASPLPRRLARPRCATQALGIAARPT